MLVIRSEQLRALDREAERELAEATLVHVRRRFPADWERIGESQVRRVIQRGVTRAVRYGVVTRKDVREYIYLMFILGSDFDCDPQLPWAAQVLRDPALAGEERMHRLQAKAVEYTERVAGRDGTCYVKALFRGRELALDAYGQPDGVMPLLRRLWPQKVDDLSPDALAALLELGDVRRRRYRLAAPAGAALYVVLMFMLGTGFDRDPLHPWAEAILVDALDPVAKASRLHAAAMGQIDTALRLLRARTES